MRFTLIFTMELLRCHGKNQDAIFRVLKQKFCIKNKFNKVTLFTYTYVYKKYPDIAFAKEDAIRM